MLRHLKLIFVQIIVVIASIGATMLFMFRQGGQAAVLPSFSSADTPAEPAPAPAPIFAELAPFTVTLRGQTRNYILYVGITLRMQDQASRKIIEDYMPEVRDRTLRTLASQYIVGEPADQSQEKLAQALQAALSQPFAPQIQGPQIASVLFTAFVVQ